MCQQCSHNNTEKPKYYITTAITYTSRKPHIGNTYEVILTDAIARFKRYMGYDVFFCTGTDEHGIKIQELAQEAGISPKEYVDRVAAQIKDIWDLMNTSYDKFIRTTDDYHVETVQKIFKKLYDQGDIYLGSYEGWYCTPCESFWTDTQLADGKCPDCGREVHKQHEEAYFFKMSKYADRLMKHIEEHPEFEKIRENEYYNALQLKFAYAVTCHKAQGGQWDAVFIDQGWLPEEMLNDEYWRWLYTAITRAQERVYFVNFKEEFFEIPV